MDTSAIDSDYVKQLEVVRQIRDTITAKDEISLPQICVIGDQSAGKSSFLSRLTGVSFPTGGEMCTKAATVVTCNRDISLAEPKYEIEDIEHRGSYVEVESTAKAIQDRQDELLGGRARDNTIISDASINLRVTGPNQIDIIIVDLPGIQHAGPTKDAITALIKKNIEKPETLNLLVSEAKQDAELTEAIELAASFDPTKERTIRVLSKFDNFDTPETEARAVRMIKESLIIPSGTEANRLNLGPHAVISILRDDEEKQQLTEEYGVPESRAGIDPLKERLQPLFANLINRNLPKLKQSVCDRLNETQQHLEAVGRYAPAPIQMMIKCQTCLQKTSDEFEKQLTNDSFLPMKEHIYAAKSEITFEFATENLKLNSFECILFQGKSAFEEAARAIRTLWGPIVVAYIKKVKENAMESTHRFLRENEGTVMYRSLISAVHAKYQQHLQEEVLPKFHEACMECLKEEGSFGTTNHYFDAKFREDELCPPELVEQILSKAQTSFQNKPWNTYDFRTQLERCLTEAKTEVASTAVHEDLLHNQKNRVFTAVKAHFDVEKKTFVDNILKKTRDILIKGRKDWVQHELLRSNEILAAAGEDESIKQLRQDLLDKVERLEACLGKLRDVPLPLDDDVQEEEERTR